MSTPRASISGAARADRQNVAAGGADVDALLGHGPAGAHGLHQGSVPRLHILLVRVENLGERPAQDLVLLKSGELLRRAVEQSDIVVQIHGKDAIKGAVQDQLPLKNLLDLLEGLDPANHGPAVVGEWRGADQDWQQPVAELQLPGQLAQGLLLPQNLGNDTKILFAGRWKKLRAALTQGVLLLDPGQDFSGLVKRGYLEILVNREDRFGEVVEDQLALNGVAEDGGGELVQHPQDVRELVVLDHYRALVRHHALDTIQNVAPMGGGWRK